MARSVKQIYDAIIVAKEQDENLNVLDSTSVTAIWRLWAYITAVAIWSHETLFDDFRTEMDDMYSKQKHYKLKWFTETAKAFQYGQELPADTDLYDNTGLTFDQVEEMKVVRYAACTRHRRDEGNIFLRLKVAGESSGDLAPITSLQLDALKAYMFRVSPAVVDMDVVSLPPDKLKQSWNVYYDPLILDSNGARLDGQDPEPVRAAIKEYLFNLLFNGTYVPTYHIDAVQVVSGVIIPKLVTCQAAYGLREFETVDTMYDPDGGYLRFYNDADLQITYIPQTEIR